SLTGALSAHHPLASTIGDRVHTVVRFPEGLGRPLTDGLDVNAEQVKRGMAWVYLQYSQDAKLIALEREARAAKLGLWQQPDPVAPWQWRQANRLPHPQAEAVGFEWVTGDLRERLPP